jgi:DNA-binding MarR family transcriptional regulator
VVFVTRRFFVCVMQATYLCVVQTTVQDGPAEDHPSPPAVDSVLLALMAVGRLMRQRVDGDRLDPGTFWLLKTISASGPLRVTELASSTNLDPSTVSRHVAQLDRTGLVERTPDPVDGRAHRVQLTPAGRELLQDAFHRRHELLRRALDGWHPDDISHLDRLLGRFVGDLENFDPELEHA